MPNTPASKPAWWRQWMMPILAAAIAFPIGVLAPIPGKQPFVDVNDAILIAVLVAVGGFLAQLYLRMGKLEDKVAQLEAARSEALDKLGAAASFINRIGLWLAKGAVGPMPQPPAQIRDHIDAELWESDAPGGTD